MVSPAIEIWGWWIRVCFVESIPSGKDGQHQGLPLLQAGSNALERWGFFRAMASC